MPSTRPTSATTRSIPWALVVFAVALVVRLVYLVDSADNPTFHQPIVDSDTYDRMARAVAGGGGLDDRFFWQPFFYPAFLTVVYAVSGASILVAKVAQALLGGFTCWIAFLAARRLFDTRTALVAGWITAFYGPLIFFDTELVAAGWAAFWSILLVYLFVRAADGGPSVFWLGLACGLAMVTRPTFAPFVGAASVWLLWRARRRARWPLEAARLAIPMVLVLAVVAGLSQRVTGVPSPFPISGGVNLYIGNHPQPCETVTLRPGSEWQELNLAATSRRDAKANNAYFMGEVGRFLRDDPGGVARTLARKVLQFVSSRELPRNVDIYVFRPWSALLSALVFKVGPFGFPFGLLLPLAALGLMGRWAAMPAPLRLYVLLVPLSIVAVFVSARYRVVMTPVLAVLAGAGLTGVIAAAQQRELARWRWPLAVAVTLFALSMVPGSFCEERENYAAEMNYAVGYRHHRDGELNQAIAYYDEAIRLDPGQAEVLNQLAMAYRQQGKAQAAVLQWERAIAADPSFVEARVNLGATLVRLGRVDEGIEQYRQALQVKPDLADAHHNLGVALALQQHYEEAVAEFALAMRSARRYVRIYIDLAAQFEREGKGEVAAALRREVARWSAGGSR